MPKGVDDGKRLGEQRPGIEDKAAVAPGQLGGARAKRRVGLHVESGGEMRRQCAERGGGQRIGMRPQREPHGRHQGERVGRERGNLAARFARKQDGEKCTKRGGDGAAAAGLEPDEVGLAPRKQAIHRLRDGGVAAGGIEVPLQSSEGGLVLGCHGGQRFAVAGLKPLLAAELEAVAEGVLGRCGVGRRGGVVETREGGGDEDPHPGPLLEREGEVAPFLSGRGLG